MSVDDTTIATPLGTPQGASTNQTGQAKPRFWRRVLSSLTGLVKRTLVSTFVAPVREGRPRPSTWPVGLPAVGAVALVLYALLGLAAIFAVPLRQHGHLVLSQTSDTTLPASVIWLLMCGVVLSFALVHTAALHTSWLLRTVLFLLGAPALFFFTAAATVKAPLASIASFTLYAGLLVFTIVRSRRRFVWWEFLVVTAILAVALLGPNWVAGFGYSGSIASIDGTFATLGILVLPAMLVAGAAPAQIVVTAAESAARSPLIKPVFWVLAALAVGWLTCTTVMAVRAGSDDLSLQALAAGLVALASLAGAMALWLRRGRVSQPEPPTTYADKWMPWLYPLAAAITALLIIGMVVTITTHLLALAGINSVSTAVNNAWDSLFFDNNLVQYWRAGIGLVLLVIAWRISKRDRITEATLLSALAIAFFLDALGLVPPLAFLHERNITMTGLIAVAVALMIGVWLTARHRLDARSAGWLLTVVLLAVVYPFRNALDDPAGTALFFSTELLVLFGLTWRVLSDAEFMRGDSRHLPQATRIVLFMANSLFAATSVAFVALSRAEGMSGDNSAWVNAGDWMLGEPLFTVGLVAAIWLALHPGQIKAPGTKVPDAMSIDAELD